MYKWVLAFHIISVICWFAALFYLPRLFVYHAMSEDQISIERFKVMQRKLYRGIANPSMIATVVFGVWLVSMAPEAYLSQTWFQIKAVLVISHRIKDTEPSNGRIKRAEQSPYVPRPHEEAS